ncbi:hypothetical protein J056_001047 [Wallemia ichthyophaga EXF-994]|uniref:PH domain-containing protein n=1 Tax=Wallemia ichthyophaga (strain EXF-994 / CBS 113033) TaxID=1299270 RepID=R9AJB7_WALI9|nr:uncharacterized protein J056_001047 [Wallemia ichthyophaga EXF-994]EOR00161.1 hypothetical protein J056_001047 [Wallemia ichthyophaga EXF-994]
MISNFLHKFRSSGIEERDEVVRNKKPQQNQPIHKCHLKLKQVKIYLNDLNNSPVLYEIQDNSRGLDVIKFALSTNKLIIENPHNKVNVYEINNEIKRSIRNFEKIYDITDNWIDNNNSFLVDSNPNYLKDSLSERKSTDAIINHSSPVQLEIAPGKWAKRLLYLSNDSLHLSKSDKLKDRHFLCNLVSYDVYTFTKLYHNAPKPQRIFDDSLFGHLFIVKSQDNHSLFERKEDFSHVFAVSDSNACREWVKALTQSRTHALIHERPWLFKRPRDSKPQLKNPNDTSPEINTKLTPTKSISRRPKLDQSVSRSRSQATQSRPMDTPLSRSKTQARPSDHNVSRSKSQMIPRKGSENHSPHTQTRLVTLADESIFTQGSLLARRESDKGSSFLKHDPSGQSKSNLTRKRSGTINPTTRSK